MCRPETLNQDTRDALADWLAAEEMKKNCAASNQGSLRDYADEKRKAAVKAILKCQQDEFRRGKVLTQKGYGIPAVEVFAQSEGTRGNVGRSFARKDPTTHHYLARRN